MSQGLQHALTDGERAENELLQEIYADRPWRLLVSCMLLNQTTKVQVRRVLYPANANLGLFERYPDAAHFRRGSPTVQRTMLTPLGIQNKRVEALRRMSKEWVELMDTLETELPTADQVAELYGIGEYAVDSYAFFALRDFTKFRSGDKELKKWLLSNAEEEAWHRWYIDGWPKARVEAWLEERRTMIEEGW